VTDYQRRAAEVLRPRGLNWTPMCLPDISVVVAGEETTAREWLGELALERAAERKDAEIDERREAMVQPVTAENLRRLVERD